MRRGWGMSQPASFLRLQEKAQNCWKDCLSSRQESFLRHTEISARSSKWNQHRDKLSAEFDLHNVQGTTFRRSQLLEAKCLCSICSPCQPSQNTAPHLDGNLQSIELEAKVKPLILSNGKELNREGHPLANSSLCHWTECNRWMTDTGPVKGKV